MLMKINDLGQIRGIESKSYVTDKNKVNAIARNAAAEEKGIKNEGKSHDVDENKGR